MDATWIQDMAAAGYCPNCTGDLPLDGVCRACSGMDYGKAKPEEIEPWWDRDQWSNGVVVYSNGRVWWTCDLNSEWHRMEEA